MSGWNRAWRPMSVCAGLFGVAAIGLAGCDNAPSASPARSHAAGDAVQTAAAYAGATTERASYGDAPAAKPDLDADTPRFHGKPIWAANKTHTGQENADYQFKRDGADFNASTEQDFIAKAHDFIDHPPQGAETLKRANGDMLIYDPKGNVFAVATKDGAPRTMFRPKDGPAYWAQQKAEVDKPYTGTTRRTAASKADDSQG